MFFRTLEIMAREFPIHHPGKNTFQIQWLIQRYSCQIGKKILINFLKYTNKIGRIRCRINRDTVFLNCPKLKELADEYTTKQLKDIGTDVGSESEKNPPKKQKKNKKKNKNINTYGQDELDQMFEKFWNRYPNKADRGDAKKKWLINIVTNGVDPRMLENALTGYINCLNSKQTPIEYIKHGKTFLYQGNKKKNIPPTWEQFLKYADEKYKTKARL